MIPMMDNYYYITYLIITQIRCLLFQPQVPTLEASSHLSWQHLTSSVTCFCFFWPWGFSDNPAWDASMTLLGRHPRAADPQTMACVNLSAVGPWMDKCKSHSMCFSKTPMRSCPVCSQRWPTWESTFVLNCEKAELQSFAKNPPWVFGRALIRAGM